MLIFFDAGGHKDLFSFSKATSSTELRTSGEAQKRQEQASARLIQEAEADKARIEIGEVVRRRDDVGANVDVEGSDQDRDEREKGDDWLMEGTDEFDGIPDRSAEEDG